MPSRTMSHTAFISLSSNLPSPAGEPGFNLDRGIESLAAKTDILALSRRYLTNPVGVKMPMPDFVNQVVKIRWERSAPDLLSFLMKTEAELGRKRTEDQSLGPLARTLDLDILLFGLEEWDSPELTVPHPRMFERGFVLVPLLDIWTEEDCIPGVAKARDFLLECLSKLDCSIDSLYIRQRNKI